MFSIYTVMMIVLTTIALIILDRLRLTQIMKSAYDLYLGHLMADKIHLGYGAIVRIMMAILYVSLLTHLPLHHISQAMRRGGLIGMGIYGVYNFTNLAILKGYSWQIAVIDTGRGLIQGMLIGILVWYMIGCCK